MRRDLNRLANETFDLLVIGGGIMGAAIARDASLRGLSVALVERNDFAHATSAHNSKLIHGGLRYLRNFELGLVRESLRERQIWLRIAPHLVHPLPFLLPVTDAGIGARTMLGSGLALYDLLSLDSRASDDPHQRLFAHAWLEADVAQALEPCLEHMPLDGAFRYFDAQMVAPERLALECVIDSAEFGAVPANHLEAETLVLRGGRVEAARVRDSETGNLFDVRAQTTVAALGPWSDLFLERALARPMRGFVRSKGIHLLVPPLTRSHALTIAAGRGHFFVLPADENTLLGTTDTPFDGDPDSLSVSQSEVEDFLRLVNAHLPTARLDISQVRHCYGGLRVLAGNGAGSTYDATRRAELINLEREPGARGLLAVIGGKWTTSRRVAEKAVDAILGKLARPARPCTTALRRLPGGAVDRISAFLQESSVRASAFPNSDHVARLYGSRLPQLLGIAAEDPALMRPLSPRGDVAAQIVLAVREEMALTLEDVVMRRTTMGQEGDPGTDALARAAAIMTRECGWSDARRRAEIDSVAALFRGFSS
jgi:glycerol-3-phosphate dehydrogenase